MKLWKVLGLAGLAGVTATGVIIARDQRLRVQLEPDDIRARLHDRHAHVGSAPGERRGTPVADAAAGEPTWRRLGSRWQRLVKPLVARGPRSPGRHASP